METTRTTDLATIEATEDGIAYAAGQFPVICSLCSEIYSTPEDFETRTVPPSNGRTLITSGGVAMWFRNCRCGGTMALDLEPEEA